MINMPSLLDPRLQRRYGQLVAEHLSPIQQVAAGLRSLPGTASSFASTQAAWRFYSNEQNTLPALAQPLLAHARETVTRDCQQFALVMHDWSFLSYNGHDSKKDRISLSSSGDLGYDLYTALVVSDQGDPLAPVYLGLQAKDGVHSTAAEEVEAAPSQLDAIAPVMARVAGLGWDKPVVHIIDREADSVAHYRAWDEAGQQFLVRADNARLVDHDGAERALAKIPARLRRQGLFREIREVLYHGRPARQWVAETTVTLTRPAWPHRRDGRPRKKIPGKPLTLRLVIAELRTAKGRLLARWLLLTNVSSVVPAADIALWYYWRWRIEKYFKLLKSAGHHLEQWQQETAAAVARRLLVVAMACVVVWQLQRSTEPAAQAIRDLLVRLSGRQMKRKQPATAPALLAGLWVLLSMLHVLEHYSLTEIRTLAEQMGLGVFLRRNVV
jgi:hypothetical protein